MANQDNHSRQSNDVSSGSNPAIEFAELWQLDCQPDLQDFLTRHTPGSQEQALDIICVDQRERWMRGERPSAESYLDILRSYCDDQEYEVDLVYGEYLIRRELGDAPSLDEFAERFPSLFDQLRRQVAFHDAFDSSTASNTVEDVRTAHAPRIEVRKFPSIPGYAIKRLLGRGGMGVVYLAEQERLKRVVAIKMLQIGDSVTSADRFRAEAEAVARLQHPNIVQVFEAGEHEARLYLVMEFVEGDSLAAQLQDRPMQARAAAELLESLARAVHYAHSHGVIHRDLKPANVLLMPNGAPKLTDFGLAKRLDVETTLTQSGQILGTPSYMAPEQATGHIHEVGPVSDVYALGAILYECLTGRPPFKGATTYETVLQVLQTDVVPPRQLQASVPRDLETICLKCLHKNPARRYASAADFADDLLRYLEHRPITARPVGFLERAARWTVRRPAAAALIGLVIVAVMGILGRALWLERQQSLRREQSRAIVASALKRTTDLQAELNWADGLRTLIQVEPQLDDADSDELRQQFQDAKDALNNLAAGNEKAIQKLRDLSKGISPPGNKVEHQNVSIDISPDGEQLVFVAADGDLYLFHVPTSAVTRLTNTEDEEMTPSFSPDGKSIVYAAGPKGPGGARSIYVRTIDGAKVQRLTEAREVSDRSPSFSADGAMIVFARAFRQRPYAGGGWTWDQWDLCTMRADGTKQKRLTNESYYSIDSLRVTRDGASIVYTANRTDEEFKLHSVARIVDVNGNRPPQPLGDAPGKGEFGAWASQVALSPNGRQIVVVSDRAEPYRYDLILLNNDGTNPRPLGATTASKYNQHPVFARDGKSLYFLAGTQWNAFQRPIYSLWKVYVDGSGLRQVADSGLFTNPNLWKPK